nr:Gag-Pol polyprotein [Tanacetum cinerariifolium]
MFVSSDLTVLKLQTAEDLQGDALLHYDVEIELMNLILLSIPNDIYNSMDACTLAKDMWKRVEQQMMGTIQNKVDRETHFTNEFDQFVAEPGEAFVSVYNRFSQMMNDLERNDMHFPIITINTKFLNTHTGSSFINTSSYYVTHPTYVVDYDDEYQQDDIQTKSKDPLTSAMLLLAQAITQNFSNPTNNRLRTSSNTRNQAVIQDLKDKLKKNVDLILKLGNSLQGMFMLGPKPLSVYDQQLKHGLRYSNPYTLKQAISQCPKLYLASSLGNSEIPFNVKDNEDTLDDASKSQQKVKEKMNDPIAVVNKQNCWILDYQQINALYKYFVPQKELSAEQKYFSSFLFLLPRTQKKLLLSRHQCHDIKEMKDVFESTESELCELQKQNNFLKDQLLEASLKHQVEISVLLHHECVDNSLHAEIEQIQRKSIKIQEGLQARINILEKGDDLLTGGRESNLYTIFISDMAASSPVCFMSKETLTKSWLWHRRLSHLNFGTINDLTRLDLVNGLPKFKYKKDHLCSTYERGKIKKASHPPKLVPSDNSKLELLHMDLCGPMRVAS